MCYHVGRLQLWFETNVMASKNLMQVVCVCLCVCVCVCVSVHAYVREKKRRGASVRFQCGINIFNINFASADDLCLEAGKQLSRYYTFTKKASLWLHQLVTVAKLALYTHQSKSRGLEKLWINAARGEYCVVAYQLWV